MEQPKLPAQTVEHLREIGNELAREITQPGSIEFEETFFFIPTRRAIAIGQSAVLEVLRDTGEQREDDMQNVILEQWQEHPDLDLSGRQNEFIEVQRDILERGVRRLHSRGILIPNAKRNSIHSEYNDFDPVAEYESKGSPNL